MPTCIKCRNPFPNRIYLQGKERNLQRRKRCLSCMPFGSPREQYLKGTQHRAKTSKIVYKNDLVICGCGRSYKYEKEKGHTLTKCNSCTVNERRFQLKDKLLSYLGGKCFFCSYNKCKRALIFHHKNPSEKSFSIGGNHTRKWQVLKHELDKCILVCANCHAELHDNLLSL